MGSLYLSLRGQVTPNKAAISGKYKKNAVWGYRPRIFFKKFPALDHFGIAGQQTVKPHFGTENGDSQDVGLQYDKPSDPPVTEALLDF